MQFLKAKLCREPKQINEFVGKTKFPDLKDKIVTSILQSEITVLKEHIGQYVYSILTKGRGYPLYKTPDGTFWANGLDDRNYLHESFSIFKSKDEILKSLNDGVPKNSHACEIEQITILDDKIRLVSIEVLFANNDVKISENCK